MSALIGWWVTLKICMCTVVDFQSSPPIVELVQFHLELKGTRHTLVKESAHGRVIRMWGEGWVWGERWGGGGERNVVEPTNTQADVSLVDRRMSQCTL